MAGVWSRGFAAMIPARAAARRRCGPEAVLSVRYEGYGPGDSAVIVDCLTGDPERTGAAVRAAFLSHGGRLGAAGSVAYLFKKVGRLAYPPAAGLGSRLDLLWEAGAEDIVVGRDGSVEVLTDPAELDDVRSRLASVAAAAAEAELTYRAPVRAEVSAPQAAQMAGLLKALGELEGVRGIYTNAENAGELLESV